MVGNSGDLHYSDWPRQMWYADPIHITGSNDMAFKDQVLRDQIISESVIPTLLKSLEGYFPPGLSSDVEDILNLMRVLELSP